MSKHISILLYYLNESSSMHLTCVCATSLLNVTSNEFTPLRFLALLSVSQQDYGRVQRRTITFWGNLRHLGCVHVVLVSQKNEFLTGQMCVKAPSNLKNNSKKRFQSYFCSSSEQRKLIFTVASLLFPHNILKLMNTSGQNKSYLVGK